MPSFKDLAEAENQLDAAIDRLPADWPLAQPYGNAIRGERTARELRMVGTSIIGVLNARQLLFVINHNAGKPELADLTEKQVDLVCARGRLVARRLQLGSMATASFIMPDTALEEAIAACPEAADEQRAHLRQAMECGWQIRVVGKSTLVAAGRRLHPHFVGSYTFDGMPGHPAHGAYLHTDPPDYETTPHEYWQDDSASLRRHHALYEELMDTAELLAL